MSHTRAALAVSKTSETLDELLHRAFGFRSFRANQRAVCQASIKGRDVLLVMPTGAGKSLCYQLPALARGGTTLVVSPLIALMEDQAAKLSALGLSVARIHSGMDRSASRQACIDYLNGSLNFLFIAPERLRVPGFAEMLAKRRPSLIAIDEAHCISQWGHDFRPDYRTLGQHMPALRPAPVIALTATATPVVQKDIVQQLGMVQPACFIHGFRRENLAIEVVEVVPSRRSESVCTLLSKEERRPAIVYAPTRKQAEALARELSQIFPAAAYHAGLDPEHRDKVQRQFLAGRLQAVVATIAFGMGIDKADVRTVIHTALPSSLEAYYQEIGRAGRDGKPSRTILMYSWSDRRMQDFFFERDYPRAEVLDNIYRKLARDPRNREELRESLHMDPDTFDKAMEKLTIHGGSVLDYADNVTAGDTGWRTSYVSQAQRRRTQIELVMRFAESTQCRMSALVRHFGDNADGQRACGVCDSCAPERCVARRFRTGTGEERSTVQAIVEALRSTLSRSTGKLYKELFPREDMSRNDFEDLLAAMARLGLVDLEDAEFETEGRTIPYRKATLTLKGENLEKAAPLNLVMKHSAAASGGKRQGSGKKPSKPRQEPDVTLSSSGEELAKRLVEWRMAEARERNVPAYCILSNKTLRAIAHEAPATEDDLLTIPGIGPAKAANFGEAICRICSGGSPA
ncbi:MAG TPA: ATP-dependent DNA helicase RecQ [Acidisarcina sp.]|nr:ATP-dependent DNA helicase RecQ [Acidisarcina sp.]